MPQFRRLLDFLCFGMILLMEPVVVWAAKGEEKKEPEWVLSYVLLLLFLGLAILILLRPGKRKDTALTQEEIDAERAKTAGKKHGH